MAMRPEDIKPGFSEFVSFAAGRPLTRRMLNKPPIVPLPASNLPECIPLDAFDCKDGEGGEGEEYDTMFKVA